MPSEKPWTSSSALPRNWILTKIMPPDCLAWQPGGVFVYGGFDGYGMTRRNVVYLPIYSRFQSTCHIRGMTDLNLRHLAPKAFQSTCHIRGMTQRCRTCSKACIFQSTCHIRGMTLRTTAGDDAVNISIHMPHTWHDNKLDRRAMDKFISIHMPHTWHDARDRTRSPSPLDFNPHATYVA